MKLKKFAVSALTTMTVATSAMGMNASAATYTRSTDNDPVASGYSYDAYNMTYYNGMTGLIIVTCAFHPLFMIVTHIILGFIQE